jgi:hypothetical protein
MGATTFAPLSLDLISEGQFLRDIDEDLKDLQTKLALFHRKYGSDALKSVAKLKIVIALKVENDEAEGAFSITTSIESVEPKRPAECTLAIGGIDDDRKLALFVRKSGSDEHHPAQLKLTTADGRIIDQETGRVLHDPAND